MGQERGGAELVGESEPRRVRIELHSKQDSGSGVLAYKGMLYPRKNAIYIKYAEEDEGRGRCSVTFKWDSEGLTLLRHGEVQGEQSFRPGRRTTGWHSTAAGRLWLETETSALKWNGDAYGRLPFEIEWQYELWVNEQSADRFDLKLRVWEDKEE